MNGTNFCHKSCVSIVMIYGSEYPANIAICNMMAECKESRLLNVESYVESSLWKFLMKQKNKKKNKMISMINHRLDFFNVLKHSPV